MQISSQHIPRLHLSLSLRFYQSLPAVAPQLFDIIIVIKKSLNRLNKCIFDVSASLSSVSSSSLCEVGFCDWRIKLWDSAARWRSCRVSLTWNQCFILSVNKSILWTPASQRPASHQPNCSWHSANRLQSLRWDWNCTATTSPSSSSSSYRSICWHITRFQSSFLTPELIFVFFSYVTSLGP